MTETERARPPLTERAATISARLPALYRDGELVNGLLDAVAVQHEFVDDDARRVQRRHWFDTAPDFDDAARLGALLDIPPEPWQALGEYRAWFHALRSARLRHGAVTGPALRGFVEEYVEAFESADDLDVLRALDDWSEEPATVGHAFVENPKRTHGALFGDLAGLTPLHRQVVVNGGLEPTALSWVMTGAAGGPEYVPVVANLTTGTAIVFSGALPRGRRLWVRADESGVVAEFEGRDVTDRLQSIHRFAPGEPWTPADVNAPPSALLLDRGDNELWFLPVAHFDRPGLDRVLLALADIDLEQGRWGETTFDHSLFLQDSAASIHLSWCETTPATVVVDLDAGVMRSPAGRLDGALENRAQLEQSLDQGISALVAAGVVGTVRMRPLATSQRQRDHLRMVLPITQREVGTMGIDNLPDAGGVFGVTDFGDSTYR